MVIIKLLLSFISPNLIYNNNAENMLSSQIDIHKNKHLGYDERYVNYFTNITSNITSYTFQKTEKTTEKTNILHILRYMKILEKINKLQNIGVSNIHDETIQSILRDEIDYADICPYNIKAGGLLSDW
jgi:hypothetical protein